MSYPVAVGCVFGEDDGVLWLLQLLEVVAADPCVAKWSWQQDWHCDDVTSLPNTCNDQTHHWCRYACNNPATGPFSVPFYCKCHSLDWCVSIFHLWSKSLQLELEFNFSCFTFLSSFAEGLHFSAFLVTYIRILFHINMGVVRIRQRLIVFILQVKGPERKAVHWVSWCKRRLPLSSPTPMPPRTTRNQKYEDDSKLLFCTIFMLLVVCFFRTLAQQEIGSLRRQVDSTELIDWFAQSIYIHRTAPTTSSITTMFTESLVLCARLHETLARSDVTLCRLMSIASLILLHVQSYTCRRRPRRSTVWWWWRQRRRFSRSSSS